MIEEIAKQILQAIKNFGSEKIDDYLDLRDTSSFDESWENADQEITTYIDKNDLTFHNQEKLLREKVFKSVAKLTHHYELAEYISEDAGLIFANQYFKVNNKFTNWLLESYKSGNLPQ